MILGAYGSSQINIGLNVHLRDNFSGPARQVKAAFGTLKQELSMYQNNLREARNMYGQMFAAGSVATMGMYQMVKQGARFDDTMRGVAAAAGATKGEFKTLSDLANNIGSTTMFRPQEAAAAMRELGLANFNTQGILKATAPIVNLAGASMTDLATSSGIAVNTMYQFSLQADQMGYISDLLTYASNKSAINLTDLGESLKYVSSTATDLGQKLPDVLSMLMVLGNAGLKGSIAGVGMENMYRYMALGLGEYGKTGRSKTWAAFGLDPKQLVTAKGDLKPVKDIMQGLAEASVGGNVNTQNLLFQIFGVRGKRPVSKLLESLKGANGGQWAEYDKMLHDKGAMGGFAKNIMDYRMAGPQGALDRMAGAWDAFKNQFTIAIVPLVVAVTKLLTTLSQIGSWFASTTVGRIALSWLAGFILIKTAVWGIKFALSSVYLAQSMVHGSFEGIKASMMTGWEQLTGSVRRYGNTVVAANFATMRMGAGVGGRAGGFRPAYASGAGVAAVMGMNGLIAGAGGRYFMRNAAGGVTRVGLQTAYNMSTRIANPVGFGAGMGRGLYASTVTGAGVAGGAIGSGAARAGLGLGARALGWLTGPWGFAAMTALTLLPALFSGWGNKIDANTGSVESNTAATNKNSAESRLALARLSDAIGTSETIVRRLYKESGNPEMADFLLEQRKQEYLQNPGRWAGKKFYDTSSPIELNVYQNGRLTDTIRDEMNKAVNVVLHP